MLRGEQLAEQPGIGAAARQVLRALAVLRGLEPHVRGERRFQSGPSRIAKLPGETDEGGRLDAGTLRDAAHGRHHHFIGMVDDEARRLLHLGRQCGE